MCDLVGAPSFAPTATSVPVGGIFAAPDGHSLDLVLGAFTVPYVHMGLAMMDKALLTAGLPTVHLLGQQVSALWWLYVMSLRRTSISNHSCLRRHLCVVLRRRVLHGSPLVCEEEEGVTRVAQAATLQRNPAEVGNKGTLCRA
jgi:hypothetical protein